MAKSDKYGQLPAKIEETTERGRWHFRRKPYSSIDVSEYIKKINEGAKHG